MTKTGGSTTAAISAGLQMRDVWGRSQNEVFIAISDPTFASYKCGDKFLDVVESPAPVTATATVSVTATADRGCHGNGVGDCTDRNSRC